MKKEYKESLKKIVERFKQDKATTENKKFCFIFDVLKVFEKSGAITSKELYEIIIGEDLEIDGYSPVVSQQYQDDEYLDL